jgi:TatD DNase family protein
MYDIHCHLDALNTLPTGIRGLISSGINLSSWKAHQELSRKQPINVSLGLHPFFVTENSMQELDQLETFLTDPSVLAIGEIGLDHQKNSPGDRQMQKPVFIRQLEMASAKSLPIIIHCRKAYDEVFECLNKETQAGVVFHSFSGHVQDHQKALKRGDYISFGFPISYADNKKQRAMLAATPMDRIMFETDSPYMNRVMGKESSPDDVRYVYESAAQLKKVSVEVMVEQVRQNAKRLWPMFRELK